MTQDELASLPFAELRDRLQARAEALGNTEDIDLVEVVRYLTTLADHAHTPDSVDALFHLSRNFYHASRPAQTIQAASLASRLAIRKLCPCNTKVLQMLCNSKPVALYSTTPCVLNRTACKLEFSNGFNILLRRPSTPKRLMDMIFIAYFGSPNSHAASRP